MKKWLKYGIYGLIISAVIWGIVGYVQAKNAPLKVKTAKVQRKNLETSITSSGKIQPRISYALNFTSSGRVSYLPFEEGDAVEKGQVVARLQTDESYQQMKKAEADYRLTIEKIREFEYNNKDKPRSDQYNLQRYQLEATRDSSKALYDQTRSTQGNKILTSPISGIITQISVKAGEVSSAVTSVMTVAQLEELEFVAEIDEQDAGRLQEEQPAQVSLDAIAETKIPGIIYYISQIAKTNATGGTYYPTKISLTEDNQYIRSGMNGDTTIRTASVENVLSVPSETVVEDDRSKFVYIIENGKAKKITITVGLENDTESEIKSGLSEGAEIIIPEAETLKEGTKVAKTQ
ncbi:MAG: efflux RND transporter periplasmic adaptor subunit [bacterium]|nr:efflux RND transporter periplasmic adaptor subunit [bacterium]